MDTAKRTTSGHGIGGRLVRTSSSSQAGARNPRSATSRACHPGPGDSGCLGWTDMVASLGEVLAALDARYDPALAESWDAVGLVCGDRSEPVRRVLFAVDPVEEVVDEALEAGVGLVVTHHPLFLTAVHGVPADDPKGRLVHRLIRAGTGLFVAHTNADRAADVGVNDALAAAVGLTGAVPLEPVGPGSREGLGRIGRDAGGPTLRGFAERAARALPATAGGVRLAGELDRPVRTAAVCGGTGGSLWEA